MIPVTGPHIIEASKCSPKGFSGSSILGDGRSILILDVIGLLEEANQIKI